MKPSQATANVPPAIHELAQTIGNHTAVRRVILFGSRARGDHMPRSDVDLAVDAPGIGVKEWFELEEAAEMAPTLLKIDLADMSGISEDMRAAIGREGLVLYERRA